tara:strand:+ start:2229 stop:7241 length:5013 start_codon:yes stop_codon:yes gene_type:complete
LYEILDTYTATGGVVTSGGPGGVTEAVPDHDDMDLGLDGEAVAGRYDTIVSTMTRIDADISFYFSTWEGFDVDGTADDLFSTLTSAVGSDKGMYVTLFISFDSGMTADQQTFRRVKKTEIVEQLDVGAIQIRNAITSRAAGSIDYNEMTISLATTRPGATGYLVSLPLSEFYEVAELTPQLDADDNPVIRFSNIKLTTYVKDFVGKQNIRLFCCTSTMHPYEVRAGTSDAMDPLTVSINYSDITYEGVMKNGTLATFGEPVFVDGQGVHYPQQPLRGINTLYYKTKDFGSKEIVGSVNSLMAEYEERARADEELEQMLDETKFVLEIYEDDINLLPNLNKVAQGLSVTNEDSRGTLFTQRLRILINNIDAMLTRQEQVVKRVFRNYKIVDNRAFFTPELRSISHVADLPHREFIYQNVYNSNIATYVPMISAGTSYPGQAELPATPAEMASEFKDNMNALRRQIENLISPMYSAGGFSYGGFKNAYSSLYTPESPEAVQRRLSAEKFNFAIDQMTDWAFDNWASRMIKGSAHPAYQNSPDHAGAHYYLCREVAIRKGKGKAKDRPPRDSSEWNDDGRVSKGRLDQDRQLWSGTGKGNDSYLDSAPQHFWNCVLSTKPEAARSHLRDDVYESYNFRGDSSSDNIDRKPQDTMDIRGYAERTTGGDPEATLQKFGYLREGGMPRPDTMGVYRGLAYQHPSVADFHNTFTDGIFNQGDWPKRVYFNRYFWSDTAYRSLWALYTLAQQDHQIEFFVPKRMAPITTSPTLIGQGAGADIDPYDYVSAVENSDGILEHGQEEADFTRAGLATAYSPSALAQQESNYDGVLQYRNHYYEKIGGVSCIYKNSYTDSSPSYFQPDDISLAANRRSIRTLDDIGWWRCTRKKKSNIRKNIQKVIYSAYGIETTGGGAPSTSYSAAGEGALEGGERSSTNPTTEMDTYIAEGPYRIAEAALSEVLGKIDDMSSESAADFDFESEREYWANVFTDQIVQKVHNLAGEYYDTKLCKIYACTALPPDNQTRVLIIGDTEQAVSPMFQRLDYATPAGGSNRGTDPYPVIPFGLWNLPPEIPKANNRVYMTQHNAQSETSVANLGDGGKDRVSGGSGHFDFYEYNFGKDFQDIVKTNVDLNRDRIYEKIYEYITKRALYAGFNSDTGIHSALAEVDIVLSKYGYFFFDMEKYIRKSSYLSKVMNVDRFLANFPTARQITNSACKLKQVAVNLDNFSDHPDGTDTGGFGGVRNLAQLVLTKADETDEEKSRPEKFKNLRFLTPLNERTGRPYVYRKINALQGISFKEITEYTKAAAPLEASPGMSSDLGGEFAGYASATGASAASAIGAPVGDPGSVAPDTTPGSGPGGTSLIPPEDFFPVGFTPGLTEEQGDSRVAQQSAIEAQIRGLDFNSVDIERLIADGKYEPKEVNTHLVLRNYAFPGFSDAALAGGQRWRFDYRLMMFKYQFFLDDDDAYSFKNDPEVDEGIESYDNIRFSVRIIDESKDAFYSMVKTYRDIYRGFVTNYFEFAEEACAFNAFDQRFNEFFVTQMKNKYPTPPNTPWHRMVAVFTTFVNIMTDQYGGDSVIMFESANNLLEIIRPETGNLGALKNFHENARNMLVTLERAAQFLELDLTADGVDKTEFNFRYEAVIGAPVIDHIGDYSEDLTDPAIAEFGGNESLYDMDDF